MHDLLENEHWSGDLVDMPTAVIEPEFSIGEVAREFGITFRALRFYESRGLIAPQRRKRIRDRYSLVTNGRDLLHFSP